MTNNSIKLFYALSTMLIALFLFVFFYETYHYQYISDDLWINDLLTAKGFSKAYQELYLEVNGRWFSHVWVLTFFKLLRTHQNLAFIYQGFMLILFFIGNRLLLKQVFFQLYNKIFHPHLLHFTSLLFTSSLFFSFPEGRVEVWYWLSSISVHLLSLIVMQFLFAYALIDNTSKLIMFLLILCASAIGGMSETYCIVSLVLIVIAFKKNVIAKNKTSIVSIFLLFGLMLNIIGTGLLSRISLLPEPNLMQALKNTLHSMLLPFMAINYLGFKLMAVVFTFFAGGIIAHSMGISPSKFNEKTLGKDFLLVLALIFISFFVPCYLLSDITAFRMQSFAYYIFLAYILQLGFQRPFSKV